jgi:hypothetical protein
MLAGGTLAISTAIGAIRCDDGSAACSTNRVRRDLRIEADANRVFRVAAPPARVLIA